MSVQSSLGSVVAIRKREKTKRDRCRKESETRPVSYALTDSRKKG